MGAFVARLLQAQLSLVLIGRAVTGFSELREENGLKTRWKAPHGPSVSKRVLIEWLLSGAIDENLRLECDLTGPGYELDNKVRVKLESKVEMKKRGLDSPDDADVLALTFARPVAHRKLELSTRPQYWYPDYDEQRWMM